MKIAPWQQEQREVRDVDVFGLQEAQKFVEDLKYHVDFLEQTIHSKVLGKQLKFGEYLQHLATNPGSYNSEHALKELGGYVVDIGLHIENGVFPMFQDMFKQFRDTKVKLDLTKGELQRTIEELRQNLLASEANGKIREDECKLLRKEIETLQLRDHDVSKEVSSFLSKIDTRYNEFVDDMQRGLTTLGKVCEQKTVIEEHRVPEPILDDVTLPDLPMMEEAVKNAVWESEEAESEPENELEDAPPLATPQADAKPTPLKPPKHAPNQTLAEPERSSTK